MNCIDLPDRREVARAIGNALSRHRQGGTYLDAADSVLALIANPDPS
ncbi:hypothetical protein [Pseudactinotalea sp. HY160]|nr:hypothetical protein [Pseudactinotalea sp. HY160]